MKYPLLKNYINEYSKNRIQIIKYWLKNREILLILNKSELSTEFFVKNYAVAIIDYYIDIVNEKREIGDCPAIEELILYLKEKGITTSELFTICTGFKNSLIEYAYDLKISNLQIEKEINFIFEKNFAGVLEKYSKSLTNVENQLSKQNDIINKYVIMSRTDLKGIIISVSDAFCKISGYEEDELIGQSHNIIRHVEMPSSVFKDMWKSLKEEKPWHGEIKNRKKNGGYYWVDTIVSPVLNDKDEVIAYEAIMQNITNQKELENQQSILVEQSKSAAMGEMISMIAHQWRQPLQAVSILTQKLPLTKTMEGEIPDELLDQVVEDISSQLDYMSRTIDDFRDFFLPDRPKEEVRVEKALNKAIDFVSFMLKSDCIEVSIDIKTQKEIETHINELIQVFINLLKNARDVLVEKDIDEKEINITIYEEINEVIIEIEDNAGGVPEDIIGKIFDPYFSTKKDKNGTGLGLYMCKTIVETHSNGKLSVNNSEKGAVFKIALPAI